MKLRDSLSPNSQRMSSGSSSDEEWGKPKKSPNKRLRKVTVNAVQEGRPRRGNAKGSSTFIHKVFGKHTQSLVVDHGTFTVFTNVAKYTRYGKLQASRTCDRIFG